MLSKDKFFEIINYIQEVDKFENDFNKLLTKYPTRETDFLNGAMFSDLKMEDYVVQLLEEIFEDRNHWISYWLYELYQGKYWTEDSVLDEYNQPIKLKTKEDLYNLLIQNQFEDFIGGTD